MERLYYSPKNGINELLLQRFGGFKGVPLKVNYIPISNINQAARYLQFDYIRYGKGVIIDLVAGQMLN